MKHRFSGRSKPPSHVRVRPRRIEEGLAALSLGDTNLDLHGLAERDGMSDGAQRTTRAAPSGLRRFGAEPLTPELVLSCAPPCACGRRLPTSRPTRWRQPA